jgi:hypothetical protein
LPSHVRTVVLLHLSETNNRPEIARATAEDALAGRDVQLFVASQDESLIVPERAPLRPPTIAAVPRATPVQLALF